MAKFLTKLTIPAGTSSGHAVNKGQLDAASVVVATFSYGGPLQVAVGTFRWYNDTGRTLTINSVRASVGTAPTGAAVLVDVDVDGTTIYGTQANRPTIAVSTNTDVAGAASTTTIAAGHYLTVDIDQIGSTVTGSDLVVSVTMQ